MGEVPPVTFVLGLCGAGKSEIVRDRVGRGFVPCDEGSIPGYANWPVFVEALRAAKNCVVAEIAYYQEAHRRWASAVVALFPGYVIEWVCYENTHAVADENRRKDVAAGKRTSEQCAANLSQNASTIMALTTGVYSFPHDAVMRPIHRL